MKVYGLHDKYRRPDRRKLRERLSESQNHRCAYCSKDIRNDCTIDHIIPVSAKGPLTYWNCVAACDRCNQKRHNRDALSYFEKISLTLRTDKLFRARIGLAA